MSQVTIDAATPIEELPWALWPVPEATHVNTHDIRASVDDDRLYIGTDEAHGTPTLGALRSLSERINFPPEFVTKLPTTLQADIINNRIASYRDADFSLVMEHSTNPMMPSVVASVAPGQRLVLPHAAVAQTAYETIRAVFDTEALVADTTLASDHSLVRFKIPYDAPIRPDGGRSVGDVLRMGVELKHVYGVEISTRLYTERLRCLNGMTAFQSEYSWGARIMGTQQMQIDWIKFGVSQALTSFPQIVERARLMASTRIEGDLARALMERARALRLPRRLTGQLMEAFNQEPGDTEWDMLNAFTRLATHGGLDEATARALAHGAGTWVQGFDMVTARLPRPIAVSVGAHVLEEASPSPADGDVIDV